MSGLPTIAPRLVVATVDVQELLSQLAEEHTSLQDELHRVTLELEALTACSPGWAAFEDAVIKAATEDVRRRCVERHDSAGTDIGTLVERGEAAAAARVAAAAAEASALLAAARTELGDRLVAELRGEEPHHAEPDHVEPHHAEPDHVEPHHAEPDHVGPDHAGPDHAGLDHVDAASWDDAGPDVESFRSFWSEHDQGASVREAMAAPLVAIAPMLFALLVMVFVLLLFV